MSDYPMLISNKLHSFRNFMLLRYKYFTTEYTKYRRVLSSVLKNSAVLCILCGEIFK